MSPVLVWGEVQGRSRRPLLGRSSAAAACGRAGEWERAVAVLAEAERRGIELLGEIPLSLEVRTGGDSGTPVVVASPRSEQAKTYRSIARRLIEVADLRKVDEEEEVS